MLHFWLAFKEVRLILHAVCELVSVLCFRFCLVFFLFFFSQSVSMTTVFTKM